MGVGKKNDIMKKVIFFGGKKIGYRCLELLCSNSQISLSLIITNTSDLYDKNDRWYPKIYDLAVSHKIPYLSTDLPNSDEVISIIKGIEPDLMFVVYYDNILKPKLFKLAKEGVINLHLANAEKYRGCYSTTFAIINGEKEYGVTLHYIDEGIDTGPVIDKKVFELKREWTGKDLYDMATGEGFKLFQENLNSIIEENAVSQKQKTSEELKFYKKSQFPSHNITFEGSGEDVYNRIRALMFPPFPHPYFYIGDRKIYLRETWIRKGGSIARQNTEKR